METGTEVRVEDIYELQSINGEEYEERGIIEPWESPVDPDSIEEILDSPDTLRILVRESGLMGWGPYTHVIVSEHEGSWLYGTQHPHTDPLRYYWLARLEKNSDGEDAEEA